MVVDQVVEPREVFQPTDLVTGELLGGLQSTRGSCDQRGQVMMCAEPSR